MRTAHIEISHSERYSIGDGPLVLWVSGPAGWFEIRPSPAYQRMYDQVREAITLYYSAFEVYESYVAACASKKKTRRPRPPSLDDIFLKYAVRAGDGILHHEVVALYNKWAEFLIAHFDKEFDLDWSVTPFAKWLRSSHPVCATICSCNTIQLTLYRIYRRKSPILRTALLLPRPFQSPKNPSTIRRLIAGGASQRGRVAETAKPETTHRVVQCHRQSPKKPGSS